LTIGVYSTPNLAAAALYPGLACFEFSNLSVGRGTDSPFEQIGADFIVGRDLATYLNQREIPGVRAYATSFTPTESVLKGVKVEGVRFVVTNRELLDGTRLGLELAVGMQKLYPGKVDFSLSKRLIGSDDVIRRIQAAEDPRTIQQSFQDAVDAFETVITARPGPGTPPGGPAAANGNQQAETGESQERPPRGPDDRG
jgi:uncharacterized protein YbbC (DUF1343 family)